jgi:hypothetical protein
MLAYTGLLWFQYNKVFAGPSALPPTAFAVLIGFAIGIPLRILRPTIFWNDVFALGVATWTAGILTFRTVNLSAPKFSEVDEDKRICHSQKSIGPHNDITSEKLDSLFNELESLPANERFSIKPPGTIASEVMQILTAAKHSPKALELKAAFPLSFALLDQIIISWDTGETIVEGVSSRHMIGQHHDVCAVSRKLDNKQLKIFVIVDSSPGMAGNLEVNCHAYATFQRS